ncbi:dienelactone hydrolase family protein [Frankia sp. EUN1f]|uniref:dienelactone hydrolase family protein n=1 Tax=Parafrankia sp. EUN1f TaxID=102897 RepID=UPI0001C449FB|nr:Carboxymethylenebutenolidase [Parafrankia sp. EUN1f]
MTTEANENHTHDHLRTEVAARDRTPATVTAPAADDPPRGGIVVIQDARGITPYLLSVCDELADAGYLAIAPHLYHRDGIAEVDPTDGWAGAIPQMGTLTGDGIHADVDDCLAHLSDAGLDPSQTAVIGFCMGGTVALATASRRPLAAAVSFYGGSVSASAWPGVPPLLDIAPALMGPWLGLYGEEDALIPLADINELRVAAARSGQPTELVSYPGAGHAFHSHDRPAVHRPEAAADAWRRTVKFLEQRVRPA